MGGSADLARKLVERVWDGAGIDVARGIVADGVVVHPARSIAPGPGGQAAVGTCFHRGFPDARWVVGDAVGDGDRAVERWRMAGRHDGAFEGVPPTGVAVGFTDITVVRIEDGQIAEIWHAEDLFGLFEQVGARPVAGIPGNGGPSGG